MFACMTTLFGCQNKSFDDGSTWEKFDLNSFELCDMSNERYEIVSPDSIDFANPTNIRIVSDNLLAVEDTQKKESVICFLNPLTHEYTKTLSTGKSTSEVVHISNIWGQDKSLHCYESTGKILKLECNPNTFETKTSLIAKMQPQAMRVSPMKNGNYLMQHFEGRYQISTSGNQIIDTIGQFPVDEIPSDLKEINLACQVDMATSPDLNHIVCANRYWNKIEIYSGDGEDEHFLSGPIEVNAKVEKFNFPGGAYTVYQNPSYSIYHCVSATKKGFMVGYIGAKSKDYQQDGVTIILSFDWDGNPKKMYKFGHLIKHFDFDEESKSLYCIVQNEEKSKIIKYILNK